MTKMTETTKMPEIDMDKLKTLKTLEMENDMLNNTTTIIYNSEIHTKYSLDQITDKAKQCINKTTQINPDFVIQSDGKEIDLPMDRKINHYKTTVVFEDGVVFVIKSVIL